MKKLLTTLCGVTAICVLGGIQPVESDGVPADVQPLPIVEVIEVVE